MVVRSHGNTLNNNGFLSSQNLLLDSKDKDLEGLGSRFFLGGIF